MKKKNIAKALALLFTASAVISLASCKKNDTPSTPSTPDTGNTDNPGGNTDNPGGNTDNPGGNTDNPGGNTDNPGGNTDTPDTPEVDETKIGTKEQFVEFLSRSSYKDEDGKAITFTLTADIDMTGAEYGAPKTFDGILDGAGHTVKNVRLVESDDLKNPTLFKVLSGAVIKDVVFENVEASGTNANQAFLATYSFGNTYIQNVKFNNATITSGGVKSGNTSIDGKCGLLVAVAYDKLSIKNVVVDGLTINAKKYTGGLIGQIYKAATVKPNGEDISVNAGDVSIENLLIKNAAVTAGTDSDGNGQSVGGVIGFMEAGTKLSINGLVADINVVGRKNVAIVVGDNKDASSEISVKNVLVANGVAKTANKGSVAGIIFGQQKADIEIENVCYIDRVVDAYDESDDNIKNQPLKNFDGDAIKAADVTAPTEAFTVADGKISLMGVELSLPTDVVTTDAAYGTMANADDKATATYDAENHKLTYSGTIRYYSAAEATTAGNYAYVKLTAAEGVDVSKARIYIDDDNVYTAKNFAEGVFIPVSFTNGEKPDDVTIVVRWGNDKNDQTYTVSFADGVVAGIALANGTLSQEDTTLTTTVEDTKITYSAGTINAAEDKKNYITVKVTAPAGLASVEDATTSTSNAVLDKGEGFVTIKLDITSLAKPTGTDRTEDSTLTFNVKWNASSDAQTYTVVINKEVKVVNDSTSETPTKQTYSFDDTTLTAISTKTDNMTIGTNNFFTLTGNSNASTPKPVTIDGTPIRVNLKGGVKTNQCSIAITTTGKATVTMKVFTTDADRKLKVLGANNKQVTTTADSTDLTAAGGTTITFELSEAGTYYIGVSTGGMYVYSMSVEC